MDRYKIRIPSDIRKDGYYTRRPEPKRVSSAHYELYIETMNDLTVDEWKAILDKMANIGGMGNLRVEKVEENENTENEGNKS